MPRNTECERCKLHTEARSVCVWGEETHPRKKPKVFCVGEAPGANEDEQARPFVGKAGQLLRMVLDEFGLNAYLSNVCKCRPPDNRVPKLGEMRACFPYLEEEIKKQKPDFILLLGTTAIKAFTGERTVKVGEQRGLSNWVYNGIPVVATYHPAAALRDAKYVDLIVDDVRRIVSKEFLRPETPKIKYLKTVHTLPKSFAFDLETTCLSPFLGKKVGILCVAWSEKAGQVSVTQDVRGFITALNKREHTKVIGHNVKFDLLWLVHYGLKMDKLDPVLDTMIMAHLLDEEGNKGLKHLVGKHTGYGNYYKDILPFRNEGRMDEVEQKDLMTYCAYDAAATMKVYDALLPACEEEGLKPLLLAQGRATKALVLMEQRGFHVNKEDLKALKGELKILLKTLVKRIEKESKGEITNPGSTQQLRKHLFDTLKLPVGKFTPKGEISTNEAALLELQANTKHKILHLLVHYREVKKTLSTYLESYEELLDEHDTLHPWFNLCGTVTGRLSCSKPNLQNIPRNNPFQVKQVFTAPTNYRYLVQADYSQIELRVGAMLSGDANMQKRLRSGEDLHQATADALFGKGANKEDRTIAKTINFGVFYGMGPKKLSETLGIPMKDARDFIHRWYQEYPGIIPWMDRVTKHLTQEGYVATVFGRRRRLSVQVEDDRDRYNALLRQAINAPVQSTAAELTLLAVTKLSEMGVPLVCTVHDSIVAVAKTKEHADTIARKMKQVMENPEKLCKDFGFTVAFPIPTPVEVTWRLDWQNMKPLQV